MKKVGIILNSLASSELAFFSVNSLNRFVVNDVSHDAVIFISEIAKPCLKPLFSIQNMVDMWSFEGTLIGTNINDGKFMINAPIRATKILYMYDLEWLRRGKNNFLYNIDVMRNPKLKLVARTQEHANLIENYCNRQVDAIIANIFNIEEFLGIE